MDNALQNSAGGDILLEIKNLYAQYNTDDAVVHALNGFHLTLHRGEKLGLVGETGAGKTTMALSILRLLPPRVGQITHGSILYDGTDILHASPKEMLGLRGERISMIFQDPMTSLNPVSTVGDQILAANLVNGAVLYQDIAVDAGCYHRFSFFARGEGSKVSVTAKVIYLNAQDQPTQGLLIQVRQQDMTNSNRDFAYYQGITIAAPAGTVKARIEFDVSTDGGQSMDLDDVSFSLA